MKIKSFLLTLTLIICLTAFGAWLLFFFNSSLLVKRSQNTGAMATTTDAQPTAPSQTEVSLGSDEAVFNPPALEDAPDDIRDAVLLGYKIMTETKKYAGQYIGNDLACTNCHFDGGRSKDTISLVGVAATYPRYRSRRDYAADLTLRTQGCFERSMNGTAPPPTGQIMQSLKAYYFWISKGIPIYSQVPWLRLSGKPNPDYNPNPAAGEIVFNTVCARCHGDEGTGSDIAPPLWGPGSFNDGAGMHKIKHFSSFSYRFMPKGDPSLTPEQAMDVAAYARTKPRPHFTSTHPNKIERVIALPKGDNS